MGTPSTKGSVLIDARGVPLGVEVNGANTHDIKLLKATFDNMPVHWPQPTSGRQRVCLDKAYDSKATVWGQATVWSNSLGTTTKLN